jgi:hypothetical protein
MPHVHSVSPQFSTPDHCNNDEHTSKTPSFHFEKVVIITEFETVGRENIKKKN